MSILKKLNERPSFYVTLPSKLKFYKDLSSDDLSILGEVGVRPLSVVHQLSVKNPEKLFNGSIVEEIIHDCTTIKTVNVRDLIKCDVDLLLLGIKIATNGATESLVCKCPFCEYEQQKEINLEGMLSSATSHSDIYTLDLSVGLSSDKEETTVRLYIRPSTYGERLQLEQEIFTDSNKLSKLYREISNMSEEEITDMADSKRADITNIVTQMTIDSLKIISQAVERVVILDANGNETLDVETDNGEIYDFIVGLGASNYNLFRDKMTEINDIGINTLLPMVCDNPECNMEFNFVFEVNIVDFFGADS